MLARVLLALYGPEMEEISMEEALAQVEEEIAADVLAAKACPEPVEGMR